MEAKQYLLSLQNNYDGDDDIAEIIAERLEKLSTVNKQKSPSLSPALGLSWKAR